MENVVKVVAFKKDYVKNISGERLFNPDIIIKT